jgi:hypothetical protein
LHTGFKFTRYLWGRKRSATIDQQATEITKRVVCCLERVPAVVENKPDLKSMKNDWKRVFAFDK